MSLLTSRKLAVICGSALAGLAAFVCIRHLDRTKPEIRPGLEASPTPHLTKANTSPEAISNASPAAAPFIITDTTTDSPGTNLVTRVVTLTATIGGTPPIFLQWKVDKRSGFVAVSASSTNSVFTISNALVADTGFYALFATNRTGDIRTTPVSLVVIEGAD
jgi:hypothetical protein